VALASHYDTKYYENLTFLGANDGGSSTGLLLELARVLAGRDDGLDYWLVFLDGEEAFIEWSTFDSTYGSRHLARRWKEDGTAGKVRALLLLDMVGDRSLGLLKDRNSTPWLMDLVWNTAAEAVSKRSCRPPRPHGRRSHPLHRCGHPQRRYHRHGLPPWHTAQDTLDKISAGSLEKVGISYWRCFRGSKGDWQEVTASSIRLGLEAL